MLQLSKGDNLFVYDIQDNTTTKIAELDYFFNGKKQTFSSTGIHNLMIQFSTDDEKKLEGFSALIHYIASNATCAYFLDSTELILNQAIECTNWIITAPFVKSTIHIKFQYFEVCI